MMKNTGSYNQWIPTFFTNIARYCQPESRFVFLKLDLEDAALILQAVHRLSLRDAHLHMLSINSVSTNQRPVFRSRDLSGPSI